MEHAVFGSRRAGNGENLLLSPSPVNVGVANERLIQHQLKGTSEWPFLASESSAAGQTRHV
jgi:hypothetical protein